MESPNKVEPPLSDPVSRAEEGISAGLARALAQVFAALYRNPAKIFRPPSIEVSAYISLPFLQPLHVIKSRGRQRLENEKKPSKSTMRVFQTVIMEEGV
jgi:hypothetical protein